MKRWFMLLTLIPQVLLLHAQQDSVQLGEVVVTAFQQRTQWKAAPVALALIRQSDFARSATPTLLTAMNALPGIRMEERSPGSYRLSIRGSLLRSPFGVRNIKVYWNQLPLTDGGGNTYLNLLDLSQLSAAEILKGPAASSYGAGTGGAVLLHSDMDFTQVGGHGGSIATAGGSYGLFQLNSHWQYTDSNLSSSLRQSHLQSDGYRQQSAMRRDGLMWQGAVRTRVQSWQWLAFYTDLFYQTPGGITLAQMQSNPRLARQAAGALPGAVQQQTAVYNRTAYAGIQHQLELGKRDQLQSFAMYSHTDFRNPFITNYERRNEKNMGLGLQWRHQFPVHEGSLVLITGGEWLQNPADINNYGNRGGKQDTLQYADAIRATQWFGYTQLQYARAGKWQLSVGASYNNQYYRYQRTSTPLVPLVDKHIDPLVTPRLALSVAVHRHANIYAVMAKGFSAPTVAELRPSDGNFYGQLNAESGWNMELGIRGSWLQQRLWFDASVYSFQLNNAIVRRNTASGVEYFVNAGSTRQPGAELLLRYQQTLTASSRISEWLVQAGYSYQPYRFGQYISGGMDYSGNRLTGVPRHVGNLLVMVNSRGGYYLSVNANLVGALSLNDSGDTYTTAYQLVQLKLGYRTKVLHLFCAVDNLLNQVYSLGNDINAAGRRYYNPAAARNILAGLQIAFH
ncbi:MAG: TonB-dependent receptor plug domain-containing protein [Chitinophagaceae bacterium]|nr:TonB-dependent receptor plug domain-containing protein [Chitinophagaceae bacterium]